jgi:hypothetical protein
MNDYYDIKQHGLLFIVLLIHWDGIGLSYNEDSRWSDESLAIEHCRLLNETKQNIAS